MSSTGPAAATTAEFTERIQKLYDSHKFLEAYTQSRQYWTPSTNVDLLTVDELILGARLAGRLGGQRLGRWLFRKALAREPRNPRVRYFTRHLGSPRGRLIDELKDFLNEPDLGGDDDHVRGSWFASFGYTWASIRDFERAHECLRTAHTILPNDGYVLSCESDVLGMEDRWAEALEAAERGWRANPGAPYIVSGLGMSLLHLGKAQEAAERLFEAAQHCETSQILTEACWFQCAFAETLEGVEQQRILERAQGLAARMQNLAPLADREWRFNFARTNLDIADLSDDCAGIERWINEVNSPYHRQLVANLKKNPEGKRIRFPFQRSIQKHETCVPTSIASVMSAGGMKLSSDEMAAEVTFGGTPDWAAADWLRERGYHVRFFAVTENVAKQLIRNGFAFVLTWDADESGHAVAIVGLDERAETLLVHDPNSFRGTEYLLTILERNASPIGIRGMAITKQEDAARLDALLPPDADITAAAVEYQKAITLQGSTVARQVLEPLLTHFPSHPGTRYLQAVHWLDDGQVGKAFQSLKELLREFPNSPAVRVRFMWACRSLGNSALLRDTLKNIVEGNVLPGLESQQGWVRPPERYVYEYADMLRLSADSREKAESILHNLIRFQSNSSGAWHNLADVYWQKRDIERALISYRVASCLAPSDEHYARANADVLCGEDREEDAFTWLRNRVQRFGSSWHAVSTWISWISTLEDRGHPERALKGCDEALEQHKDSPELLSFAVPFYARMGEWERAEALLDKIDPSKATAAYHQAAVHFFRMKGELDLALEQANHWIEAVPHAMPARYAMLDLVAMKSGPPAAVTLSAQWLRDKKNHEDFEDAYCAQLDRASSPKWRKHSVYLRRLKRNPEDAWAWREITFDCLYRFEVLSDRAQQRIAPKIERFLPECDRTSGQIAPTIRAHALWAEARGEWSDAIELSLQAIEMEPEGFYSYRRAWECSARWPEAQRRQLWDRVEHLLLGMPGRLSVARDMMALLAERFGVKEAERVISRWIDLRPNDPHVLEAASDLLIDYGHGRSDARRALEILQPAVEKYPYFSGLRFSLAAAYRRAGQDSKSQEVLQDILRRYPDNCSARIQQAWLYQRLGDQDSAFKTLRDAHLSNPTRTDLIENHAQILIENERFAEACDLLEQSLVENPEDVSLRSSALSLFSQCGAPEKAVKAARDGVAVFQGGAYMWLLLARTLNEFRQYAEVGEIENCLRRSLALNRTLFETSDLLAILLCEQRRYEDALKVLQDVEPKMADPVFAKGRIAWIRREAGEKRAAIDQLAEAVQAAPWYSWGWSILIEWLEIDEDWDTARRLLEQIPAQMFANTSFRLKRLLLLEKAKLDRAKLDEEWVALLQDFPEDVSLHVRRYDSLHESDRLLEAAAVLDKILDVDPDSSFVLARLVEVQSRNQDKSIALNTALRVCFAPVQDSTWPIEKVWEVASNTGFADDLYREVARRIEAGERPLHQALESMANFAMRNETKRDAQPIVSVYFPGGGAKQLVNLHRALMRCSWDAGACRATIYSVLVTYGFQRIVIRLWKERKSVALSVQEWSQVGRAFVAAEMYSDGRRLFSDWRGRNGVAMWMIANYAICLSRFREDELTERYLSCKDALEGLPHDHCAKYLVYLQAEAAALLGDEQALLTTWSTYQHYFDGKIEEGEYFKAEHRDLLSDVPVAVRLLQQGERKLYAQAVRGMKWKRGHHAKDNSENPQSGMNIPWWVWWVLFLLIPTLGRLLENSK